MDAPVGSVSRDVLAQTGLAVLIRSMTMTPFRQPEK
jgi:hypothetical protein